jgi:hypothetical protein
MSTLGEFAFPRYASLKSICIPPLLPHLGGSCLACSVIDEVWVDQVSLFLRLSGDFVMTIDEALMFLYCGSGQ